MPASTAVKTLRLWFSGAGGGAIIVVEDDGDGVPEELRELVLSLSSGRLGFAKAEIKASALGSLSFVRFAVDMEAASFALNELAAALDLRCATGYHIRSSGTW